MWLAGEGEVMKGAVPKAMKWLIGTAPLVMLEVRRLVR